MTGPRRNSCKIPARPNGTICARLYRHGAVAAIVSQHLEEALTARFGLAWEARDDGHGFEIKGVSGEMIRLFSSRRESRARWS